MPYERHGKCVTKKGSDEEVGCSTSPEAAKKYLAALYANVKDSKIGQDTNLSEELVKELTIDEWESLHRLVLNFVNDFKSRYQIKISMIPWFGIYDKKYNGYVELESIKVPKDGQRQGVGSKFMTELINFSDENNIVFGLMPTKIEDIEVEKLNKFYEKFGFKYNPNQVSGEFSLTYVRYPQSVNKMHENMKKEKLELDNTAKDCKLKKADLTPEYLARKHYQFVGTIEKEIELGTAFEKREHSNNEKTARAIALAHIDEFSDYYSNKRHGLIASEKDMEKEKDKQMKKKTKNEAIMNRLSNILKERISGKQITEESNIMMVNKQPAVLTYQVLADDMTAGEITVQIGQTTLGDDTLEIVGLNLDPRFETQKTAKDAVLGLWLANEQANKIVVSPTDEAVEFWGRLGFVRLNQDFYILTRKR